MGEYDTLPVSVDERQRVGEYDTLFVWLEVIEGECVAERVWLLHFETLKEVVRHRVGEGECVAKRDWLSHFEMLVLKVAQGEGVVDSIPAVASGVITVIVGLNDALEEGELDKIPAVASGVITVMVGLNDIHGEGEVDSIPAVGSGVRIVAVGETVEPSETLTEGEDVFVEASLTTGRTAISAAESPAG